MASGEPHLGETLVVRSLPIEFAFLWRDRDERWRGGRPPDLKLNPTGHSALKPPISVYQFTSPCIAASSTFLIASWRRSVSTRIKEAPPHGPRANSSPKRPNPHILRALSGHSSSQTPGIIIMVDQDQKPTPENSTMLQAFEWYVPDDDKHWQRLRNAV